MAIEKLNNLTTEEWFSVYPYDSDIRVNYCNQLEELLDEYYDDVIENKSEVRKDDLLFLFLLWFGAIAKDQFGNDEFATQMFESNYGYSTYEKAREIAEKLFEARGTGKFNEMLRDDVQAELLAQVAYDRNVLISRNETNEICNQMLHEDAKSEYLYHVWVSCEDKRVRSTHAEANGQIQPIDEPFEVGGSYLLYPCDESLGADADEVVNCRCYEEFTNDDYELQIDDSIEKNERNFGDLERKGVGKVNVTDVSISKVKKIHLKDYTDDEMSELQSIHRSLLNTSMVLNNSNEVAYVMDTFKRKRKIVFGDEKRVGLNDDIGVRALMLGAEPLSIIVAHNHPSKETFSLPDVLFFLQGETKTMTVVNNNGKVRALNKINDKLDIVGLNGRIQLSIDKYGLAEENQDTLLKEIFSYLTKYGVEIVG